MPAALPIELKDLFDVLTVALVLWVLIVWLRRARARLALVGVAIAGAVYLLAQLAGLQLTAWVFQGFFAVLVIIVVVVSQDDLSRLFERIAVWSLRRRTVLPSTSVVDKLVRAVERMANDRTGALIVLPGRDPIVRHVEGGVDLRALVSEPLLLSLFDASSPGHDGAVLIEGDRVMRFALHLPLSANHAEVGPGGTRHAAALGLAELTDSLCIVVSEERGSVSVARDGHLRVLPNPRELLDAIRSFDQATAATADGASWRSLGRHWREGALALVLAAGLWVVRVPGATVAEVVRVAPVVVDKLPSGFELESVEPEEVKVTLSGLRRDLFFSSSDQLEVRIDALLVQLGRRTFQVAEENVQRPHGLDVVSVEPGQVVLSVRATGTAVK